jgi:hypothetical protein
MNLIDLRSAVRKAPCAVVAALWVAACSSSSDQTSNGDAGDAAAAQDVTSQDVMHDTATTRDGGGIRDASGTTDAAMVCVPLAVPCDGKEDCPSGNVCCGNLGMTANGLGYTSIGCQPTCAAPDSGASDGGLGGFGGLTLELCHAGDMCQDSTTMCGSSMYLPSFLYRCYTMGTAPPATATGGPGVHCGTATCGTTEQCCLREPMAPYCAPKGQACSCTASAADGGSDAAGSDAPADAPSAETGTDAQPEAASDSGNDAAGD